MPKSYEISFPEFLHHWVVAIGLTRSRQESQTFMHETDDLRFRVLPAIIVFIHKPCYVFTEMDL